MGIDLGQLFGLFRFGHLLDLFEFRPAGSERDLVLFRFKKVDHVIGGVIGVESFAGKNIDEGVVLVREGVDGDVRFGDQHHARNSPVLGDDAALFKNVRRHDLGHADLFREFIEGIEKEVHV